MVRHAADEILKTGLAAIAVVSNPAVERLLPEFRIVRSSGAQSQSLKMGLLQVQDEAAIIVLGDMPLIDAAIIRRIAAAPSPSALTDGKRIYPPACIPRSLFRAVEDLSGDTGARHLLQSLPDLHRLTVPPNILKDIDKPQDIKD